MMANETPTSPALEITTAPAAPAASITLPEVVVTPHDTAPLTAGVTLGARQPGIGGAPEQPKSPAHDALAAARIYGHSWDDIFGFHNSFQDQAFAAGKSQQEVDEYLGWKDPAASIDRMDNFWHGTGPEALDPFLREKDAALTEQEHGLVAGGAARRLFASELREGRVRDAKDFTDKFYNLAAQGFGSPEDGEVPDGVVARAGAISKQVAASFPSIADLTDFSLRLTADAGEPLTPGTLEQTRQNLMRAWAASGQGLATIFNQAQQDPSLRDQLVHFKPPTVKELYQPHRDAIDKFYFLPGEELADEKSVSSALKDFGIDAATYALPPLAYRHVIAPLLTHTLHALSHVPPFMRKWLGKTPIRTIDPMKAPGDVMGDVEMSAEEALKPVLPPAAEGPANEDWAAGIPPAIREGIEAGSEIIYFHSFPGNPKEALREFWYALTNRDPADAAAKEEAKKFVQAFVRAEQQGGKRNIAANYAKLEEFRKAVNAHIPEFEKWLSLGAARPVGKGATVPKLVELFRVVDGRAAGSTIAPTSPLRPSMDAIRVIHRGVREEIRAWFRQNDPKRSNLLRYYESFFRELWTDPEAADRLFLDAQGELRKPSNAVLPPIPTVSVGLEKGLTPRIIDPIENFLHTYSGLRRFLTQQNVLKGLRDAGYVKYGPQTTEAFPDRLKGWGSIKPAGPDATQFAWAAPGVARSYNAWIGRGIYDWPSYAKPAVELYKLLRYVSNASTALKLSLSLYHAVNITIEAGVAQMSVGMGEIARGELLRGAKDLIYTPLAPVLLAMRGRAFQKKYLDLGSKDPLVELATKAGFEPLGRRQTFIGAAQPTPDIGFAGRGESLIQAMRRGGLSRVISNMRREAKQIAGQANENAVRRAAFAPPRFARFLIDQFAHALDTLNAPLFDQFIPKVKSGVMMAELEALIRKNPSMGQEELHAAAGRLSDNIDDRFGELNQDNLFWNRTLKQILNLGLISIGWEYGTLRAYGNATRDAVNGEMNSPRFRWLVSFLAVSAITSSLYQGLFTGTFPWETEAKNFVLPRTGGQFHSKVTGTVPEVAMPVGYINFPLQLYKAIASAPDLMHIPYNMWGIVMNKGNVPVQTARTLLFNPGIDAIGNYVFYRPHPPMQGWGVPPTMANAFRYLLNEDFPIAFDQMQHGKPGSGIGPAQNLLGIRPAGSFFQNPDAVTKAIQRNKQKQTKAQRTREHREGLD